MNSHAEAARDEVIRRWWPTTQSLDLVQGDTAQVAQALQAEYSRILKGEPINAGWRNFPSLEDVFRSTPKFTNVPTYIVALPTRSNWTVLWNNSFLCDGYDSLCWCLTVHHALTTLHWSAHDSRTTIQSGASFCFRRREQGTVIERAVYCGQEDKRWMFHQSGIPLPEEETRTYEAKSKRHRLNEAVVLALLNRLGARPWSEDFYLVGDEPSFVIERLAPPQ